MIKWSFLHHSWPQKIQPGTLKITANRGDSLLSEWLTAVAKLQRTTHTWCLPQRATRTGEERLDHWVTVWLIQSHSGLTWWTKQEKKTDSQDWWNRRRDRWGKKKGKEILFLAPVTTLPSLWPLFHCIFIPSVFTPFMLRLPQLQLFHFFIVSYKMGLNQWLMDLPGCTYSQFGAVELLRMERKRTTEGYISFSASLSSLDSGSMETEAQQYSPPPFPALICLFSTRDRAGNIWEREGEG